MNIDKASFFLALGTFAAGDVGGYFVRDRNLLGPLPAPEPSASGVTAAMPTASAAAAHCADKGLLGCEAVQPDGK